MPRKPNKKSERITVIVNGEPIVVSLYPPNGRWKTWYAYWNGLKFAKSTGCKHLEDAVTVAEQMIRGSGQKQTLKDQVPTDEEFIEVQRRHYEKKSDSVAKKRATKSLRECLDAISAFQKISGLSPITLATPDDCEKFQREALKLPKNWRVQYADRARSRKRREANREVKTLSPNTILKWSVALQAAFERANRNGGKKCVRGVIPESRLLTENPWKNFTQIEGTQKKIRQFDERELIGLLDYFAENWPEVAVAPAFIKVCLWSWARREEVSSLKWSDERRCGNECHFTTTGKWNVTKWFRIPQTLRDELEQVRTDSDFVFAAYSDQLRKHHVQRNNKLALRQLRDVFAPENLGDWIYRQIVSWSESSPNGGACLHVFRKTGLQLALTGGHIEDGVAADASVTTGVMMGSYAQFHDPELRLKSNRTFRRIRNSLSTEVAIRYGYEENPSDLIRERLDLARSQEDWSEVARLASELKRLRGDEEGEGCST